MEGRVFKACVGWETLHKSPQGFVAVGDLVGDLVRCRYSEPPRYEERDGWHDTETEAIREVLRLLHEAREESRIRYAKEIELWEEKLETHIGATKEVKV